VSIFIEIANNVSELATCTRGFYRNNIWLILDKQVNNKCVILLCAAHKSVHSKLVKQGDS